jgi:hypothetical protein
MHSALELDDRAFLSLFDVDTNESFEALVRHFQCRKVPECPPFPARMTDVAELSDSELLLRAERLVENRFKLGAEAEVCFGDQIDWRYDPTPDPRRRWARELHRHAWLPVLAAAYQRTGDERYAVKFAQLIGDWIRRNPPPQRKDESNVVWSLMGVGMRCTVWPTAFLLFLKSPSFDRESQLLMLRSIYDHAQFLYLFKTQDNHLLRESNGLAMIAAYFPEFRDAERWKKRALSRLAREVRAQINPDGSHIEMSSGYQWLVAEEFDATLDLVERIGWRLPTDLREALERLYAWLANTCRPDGSWPQLGDGFVEPATQLRRRLAAAGKRLDRNDFAFVATRGRCGTAPPAKSISMPFGGLAVMRSDWSTDARYLLFKAGPFGGFHGHEDKLSIEVAAFGQPLLVDPGTYTYNASDPYRDHFVSSNAHNTVVVDSMSQVRRWQARHRRARRGLRERTEWTTTPAFDFASASYTDGYGKYRFQPPDHTEAIRDVTHRRSVLFVKPHYWLVVDEMHTQGLHAYTRQFQAAAAVDVTTSNEGATLSARGAGVTLQVLNPESEPVSVTSASGSESPIAGWISDGSWNHKQPAPQIAMTTSAIGPVSLLTLIYPSPGGDVMPEVSLQRTTIVVGGGNAVCVRQAHYEDWLLVSRKAGEKRFGGLSTSAQIWGFRKDSDGRGRVIFEWSPRRTSGGRPA